MLREVKGRWSIAALLLWGLFALPLAGAASCSASPTSCLNPQPEPPGVCDDSPGKGQAGRGGYAGAGVENGGSGGSATGGNDSGGTGGASPSGGSGGEPGRIIDASDGADGSAAPDDGGELGDAPHESIDAPTDAPLDAADASPTDASLDAGDALPEGATSDASGDTDAAPDAAAPGSSHTDASGSD